MARYIKRGRVLDYVPAADVEAGTPVKLGAYVGVTNHKILAGDLGGLELCGIYALPLATGATFALGDVVCFNANGEAATTGTKFGYAVEATATGATTVIARLETSLDTAST